MTSIVQLALKEKKKRNDYSSSEKKRRYCRLLKLHGPYLGFVPLYTLSKVQHKNHCLISGKAKSVYSSFRLSRHVIKKNFTFLSGLRISSW